MSPRTFVVLYSAREGSSALIDHLGAHGDVHVAGFEHLDRHSLERHVSDPDAAIAGALDTALRTGEIPGRRSTYAGEALLGFKWRPFGGRRAAEVLRRHRSQVVFVLRRNALERALRIAAQPDHHQFTTAALPAEQRAAAVDATAAASFVADPAAVAATIDGYVRTKATAWDTYCWDRRAVHVAEHERLGAEPLAVVNEILSLLGVTPFEELPYTRFVNAATGPATERCENLDEVVGDRAVEAALQRHAQLLRAIDTRRPAAPLRHLVATARASLARRRSR